LGFEGDELGLAKKDGGFPPECCFFIPSNLVHGITLLLLGLRDGFYFSDFLPSCTGTNTPSEHQTATSTGPAGRTSHPKGRQPVCPRLQAIQLNSDDIKG